MLENRMIQFLSRMKPQVGRRDIWLLGAVVFVSLAVQLFFFRQVFSNDLFFQPIGTSDHYHQWAKSILGGEILGTGVYTDSPFYSFLIALVYRLAGIQPLAVIVVQMVMGVFSSVVLFLLGKHLFNRPVALIAAGLNAFYGMGLFYAGTLLAVSLIHLFMLLVLASAYWALRQTSPWVWCLPGALLGMAVLTRPASIWMVFPLVVWIGLHHAAQSQWRKQVFKSVLLLGSMLVMISPATIRNYSILNELMLTTGQGGVNFYLGNARQATGFHKPLDPMKFSAKKKIPYFKERAEQMTNRPMTYGESNRFWFWQTWREIMSDKDHWKKIIVDKLLMFFNHYEYTTSLNYYSVRERVGVLRWPWVSFAVVFPLGVIGMLWMRRRWKQLLPWYGLFFVVLLTNVGTVVSSENRFAIMPVFFLFSGVALNSFFVRLRQQQWQTIILPVTVWLLLLGITQIGILEKDEQNYHRATAHSDFGNQFMNQENYMEAAKEFKKALDYLPGNAQLLRLHAGALLEIGLYAQALYSVEAAYRKQRDDEEILTLYANVLTATKHYALALKKRVAAISYDDKNPWLYYNLGMTCYWAGQDDRGDRAMAQAAALDPALAENCRDIRDTIFQKREAALFVVDVSQAGDDTHFNSKGRLPVYRNRPSQPPMHYRPYQPPPVQYYHYQHHQPPPPPVQYHHYQHYQPPPPPPPVQYRH